VTETLLVLVALVMLALGLALFLLEGRRRKK
jgi:hypothetical protein